MAVSLSNEPSTDGPSLEFLSQQLRSEASTRSNQATQYQNAIKLINEENYNAALQIVQGSSDSRIQNLAAVVLMRLGRPVEAVTILRRLALSSSSLDFNSAVPMHLKINLVTALFMSGKVGGCLQLIKELPGENPHVFRLLSNVKAWEASLKWMSWLDWKICGIEHVTGSIPLDFVPGELE